MSTPNLNWNQGDTFPAWEIPLTVGGVSDVLVDAQTPFFAMTFHPTSANPPPDFAGNGTFAIKNHGPSPAASILYKPDPTDVALPFNGVIFVSCFVAPSYTASDNAVYDGVALIINAT